MPNGGLCGDEGCTHAEHEAIILNETVYARLKKENAQLKEDYKEIARRYEGLQKTIRNIR